MPAVFALGERVIGNPTLATFAAFGSFAMLLLVDFSGTMADRLRAQAGLALAGAVFVCVGTVCSRSPWLAAAGMVVVGFGVLFAGAVSSVLAGATLSLLLAFILPVSLPGPVSSIPDRLAGWGMASVASLLAVALLWPAPTRDPLRKAAIEACRAIAARLRSDASFLLGGEGGIGTAEHDQAIAGARASVGALHRVFLATPYRPTGLSTAARAVVRLVDELNWLDAILAQSPPHPPGLPVNQAALRVKVAAASALERGADLLELHGGRSDELRAALVGLRKAVAATESTISLDQPAEGSVTRLISALDPGFRAQELSFSASQIGLNIDLTAAAERRSWMARVLGRQQPGLAGTLSSAQERAATHLDRHSVWLHNSVRGAIGLGLAVLVANLAGVQHSFWVVLGTLSVLRSNALNTGQSIVRALLGTVVGFVAGGALLVLVGTNMHRALDPPPIGGPLRRARTGGDLVRCRPGRVHADARDPLQHP